MEGDNIWDSDFLYKMPLNIKPSIQSSILAQISSGYTLTQSNKKNIVKTPSKCTLRRNQYSITSMLFIVLAEKIEFPSINAKPVTGNLTMICQGSPMGY